MVRLIISAELSDFNLQCYRPQGGFLLREFLTHENHNDDKS